MRLGIALIAGLTIALFWKRLRLNKRLLLALLRRYMSWETVLVQFSYLDFVILAMAFPPRR